MKKSKLSRRITWRVIAIISFFNVLIVAAIVAFVFIFSLGNGSMRGQYVTDGIAGNVETMLQLAKTVTFNNRSDIEANLDSPDHVFDALEEIIKINKRLPGCFAAFEPDYFKSSKPMPTTPIVRTLRAGRLVLHSTTISMARGISKDCP